MNLKHFFILALSVAAFTSCKKDDDNGGGGGTESPSVITITVPTTGQIILNGTAFKVEGTIADNNSLASARVEIRNKTTSAVYYNQTTTTPNTTFFRFDWTWTVSGITATTPATVKVTARDANGVEISKEMDVVLEN
ncbi:MAG: DUF4625 domain-containing protein [Chitinophagaceae bacterium]|nr:DUF4625 domain-containing protein [Chitinophagaceae bacterium]